MKVVYNEDYVLEVLLDRIENTYKLTLAKHDRDLGYSESSFLLQREQLDSVLEYIEARAVELSYIKK